MTLEEKIIALMDESKITYEVYEHEPVFTNPGVHDKSFKIKAWDLKKLCNPSFI